MYEGLTIGFTNETNMVELDREVIIDYIMRVVNKYGLGAEINNVDVYIKKFATSHLGRNLYFCNISLETHYGFVTEHGSGWTIKNSLRQALGNALEVMDRTAAESIFGRYGDIEQYFAT